MMAEWGEDKGEANRAKHGVDFADAATVLDDDFALTIPDPDSPGERLVTVGMDAFGRVLVVVYAWGDDRPRLISARRAVRREVRQYLGHRR